MKRSNNRQPNELREINIEPNFNIHAEGSVLVSFGNTKVICTATIENRVPRWMRNSEEGWITAEYGMLPRSTNERMGRAVNLKYLKGKRINIDCDVIQADGGTRTASITGGCAALFLAINNHHDDNRAINTFVAAVSLGILDDKVILDLDYQEDSSAETDLNLVMTDELKLIEIQGTGEESPFSKEQLSEMIEVGSQAIEQIIKIQKSSIK